MSLAVYIVGDRGGVLHYIHCMCYRGQRSKHLKSSPCRIGCLLSLQRYDECLEMVRVELEADDTDPHLYALRAQLNLLFGNVSHGSTSYFWG